MFELSIFKNINKEDTTKFLDFLNAKTSSFKKGDSVLNFIGNSSTIGIIIEGRAKLIRYDYSGDKTLIEELLPNSIFGGMFSNYKLDELTVEASSDVTVLFMDYYHIIKACNNDSLSCDKFLTNVIELLFNKVRINNERIEILSKKTVRDRILAYFDICSKKNLSKKFILPMTYTDLADYLSVNRSAMQRELKNLKEEGFISTKNKKITLNY